MKKLTLQEWKDWVAKNSEDSYSLVVVLSILMLWEREVKTKKEAQDYLISLDWGLSGFQGASAVSFALSHEVEGLPDPDLVKVSR